MSKVKRTVEIEDGKAVIREVSTYDIPITQPPKPETLGEAFGRAITSLIILTAILHGLNVGYSLLNSAKYISNPYENGES
jgi:hypothetical protein